MRNIKAVFFDLDGTLFDTAGDLHAALNQILLNRGLPLTPLEDFRFHIHGGTAMMLKFGLGLQSSHKDYAQIQNEFLNHYAKNITQLTTWFPDMEKLLDYLDQQKISWGI